MANRLVVFGLSVTSSWGNGHATTYRGLLRALAALGWEITFFERDVAWYRSHRDAASLPYCDVRLYGSARGARAAAAEVVGAADVAMVGSYAGEGRDLIDWLVTTDRPLVFYDIDTPVTLAALRRDGASEYLRADQIPRFDAYLSFTGGPLLAELEGVWRARHAEALYCAVDPATHRPAPEDPRFQCALGYMGTYAPDRQSKLLELLVGPARLLPGRRFLIAGPMYPPMDLPENVGLVDHVPPGDHAAFYCSNEATLNLTRGDMVRAGWSPSVRLFEAASCGTCIVSDPWPGLEAFLEPGSEVLIASTSEEVGGLLETLTPERRRAIGEAARRRVVGEHTFARRAAQFDAMYRRILRASPAARKER